MLRLDRFEKEITIDAISDGIAIKFLLWESDVGHIEFIWQIRISNDVSNVDNFEQQIVKGILKEGENAVWQILKKEYLRRQNNKEVV